jgi:hypothetical protein
MRKFNKEECNKLVQHALSERNIEFNAENISVEGVNKFLKTIDAKRLCALVMRVIEGKVYRVIGEELGVSKSRAIDLVHRAERSVRTAYDNGSLTITELSIDSPVDYLKLSVRARNALVRHNIRTIEQLIKRVDEVSSIYGVGKGTEKEIREKLVASGFDLTKM